MQLVDTVLSESRRAVHAGWPADSVVSKLEAHALARPFTHGNPALQFFFEEYFLNPFSQGSFAAIKGP